MRVKVVHRFGGVETATIDSSYAQVGKSLGLPTHAYLDATESKVLDMQAGLESGMGAMIGALSGINMISGSGMLDGMKVHTETLATGFYEGVNFKGGNFLKQRITLQLFQKEQYLPNKVIDRDSMRGWKESDSMDTVARQDACPGNPRLLQDA